MNKRYSVENQLDKLMKPNIIGDLEDVIIFQNNDGSYELFNIYHINKTDKDDYIVTMLTTFTTHQFNTLKNAVAWCTFDKRNLLQQANRILILDNLLAGLELDILIHTKIFKNSKNSENKLISLAKLNEDKLKKSRFTDELHKYIYDSKRWQTNRFNRKPL